MSAAPALAALALLAASDPAASTKDACTAASAPLARRPDVPRDVARAVDAYRSAWRLACKPGAPVDAAALLGDAEVLAEDARTSRSVRVIAAAVLQGGEAWPLPGIRSVDGDLAVDWGAFAGLAPRGSVDDTRFWRGAGVAADAFGAPAWIRDAPDAPGGECIRLGETPWAEVAAALQDMEAAEAAQYAGHARKLRERLDETLRRLATGPAVCGCVRGDPLAGLPALAAVDPEERRGTAAQRALVSTAGEVLAALRSGRVRVRWLRDGPDAPPTGCGGTP